MPSHDEASPSPALASWCLCLSVCNIMSRHLSAFTGTPPFAAGAAPAPLPAHWPVLSFRHVFVWLCAQTYWRRSSKSGPHQWRPFPADVRAEGPQRNTTPPGGAKMRAFAAAAIVAVATAGACRQAACCLVVTTAARGCTRSGFPSRSFALPADHLKYTYYFVRGLTTTALGILSRAAR